MTSSMNNRFGNTSLKDRKAEVRSMASKSNFQNPVDGHMPFKKSFAGIFMIALVSSIVLLWVSGCSKVEDDEESLTGNWFELSDFEGVPRADAVAFTIGEKAYVGTGYDGSKRLNDFWEFDAGQNSWTRKKDFPGAARNGAVGFATDTKGYIGTGYDGAGRLKDFYSYDPAIDTWTRISDFPDSARYGAVAFVIDNRAYVGTGYAENDLKDIWEYDPANDQWTKKRSLEGSKRYDAVAFVINGKGYICTGLDNGVYEYDFYEYDPANDDWTQKRAIRNISDDEYDDDYDTIIGNNKVAFVINGKGFVCTGGQGTVGTEVWEYDPFTDTWQEKTSLEATSRLQAVGFAIGDYGYVATGRNGSSYFDDILGFDPDAEQVDSYDEYLLSELQSKSQDMLAGLPTTQTHQMCLLSNGICLTGYEKQ